MTLSYDDVQKILKIIDSSALEEVHLEIGDLKLVVRRHGAARPEPTATVAGTAGPEPTVATPLPARAPDGGPSADAPATASARPSTERRAPRTGVEITAPMVGTFYRAPAPGAPPFVEVGSLVNEDDVVCILEVMKLMNSIKAGCRGRVVEICADNGMLVEFGATLMVIEPAA
jgi:acetyl-CoA carboxylase biotin carboxyl carrier protein